METLQNLICRKFTVGGKDNLPPDIWGLLKSYQKSRDGWISLDYVHGI